jgi:hypothetical protein
VYPSIQEQFSIPIALECWGSMKMDRANVDEVTKQQRGWPWRGSSSICLAEC